MIKLCFPLGLHAFSSMFFQQEICPKLGVRALAMYLGGNAQATAEVNARAFWLMVNTCLGGGFEIEYDF